LVSTTRIIVSLLTARSLLAMWATISCSSREYASHSSKIVREYIIAIPTIAEAGASRVHPRRTFAAWRASSIAVMTATEAAIEEKKKVR
jgi:hypothetical protein